MLVALRAEVEQYKGIGVGSYSRRRVVMHPAFDVFIICWRSGQQTPIHDHGGSVSWTKVLEGELSDTHYRQVHVRFCEGVYYWAVMELVRV